MGPAGYATAPTTVGSPLSLVSHPNGARVPAEGAAVLAARANHQAAHGVATTGHLLAGHLAAHAAGSAATTDGLLAKHSAAHASHAAAHASHATAHDSHAAAHAIDSAAHADHATQSLHDDSIHLVSHPGGAVVPAEGFALAAARSKHLAAHKAAADGSDETEVTVDVEP